MDGKELRSESALTERSSDGGAKFAPAAPVLPYDRSKPCPELGPSAFKVDGQGARPCAVIGPDRVAPPARDAFPKKAPVEPWLSPDSLYRRPPDYPHKMSEYQDPTRNISPRQTFQENMQRIIMPPGYNTVKVNEEPAYTLKNNKLNMPIEAKYCDVPYNVNPMNSDHKNGRSSDHGVSNVNPMIVRSVPHGWPTGSVSVRPLRPYGAPEVYHYPEYANCTGPRPPLSRTHSASHEEPPPLYPEPYYHEGSVRYKPYPNIKERYPQTRYEYLGNYGNPYHTPHIATHKQELLKTMPNHPYPGYPSAPLKYTDRAPEPNMDGYQRTFTQQANYGVPFRNPVIHSPYRSVPGNPFHNKLHPYASEASNKPPVSNKQPYDPNNKIYVDFENSRPKTYPVSDNFYLSDMSRTYTKNPIMLPNYPPANMHGVNPYIQLKNYEYTRYKSLDPSIINNPLTKLPMQFSPTALAISPADSNASNDTAHTRGASQEDCSYVSQSSITNSRSIDHRLPMDMYGRPDYRYSPVVRGTSSLATSAPCNQMSKSKKDIRQFISSWNEGDDENLENNSKRDVIKTISTETHNFTKQYEHSDSQEQLYVLGLVNVPSEELGKYEHIQKVSKLPENIKGYNSLELLNQFEEAIESSNMNNVNSPMPREIQIQPQLKTVVHKQDVIPRPISPLDVEAKISQSVIHKDVRCNFEIKPCSPKMLNVQVAAPVQTILNERVIEKVTNPQSRKSPIVVQHKNENVDSILNNKLIKYPHAGMSSSCKMANNQLLSPTVDHLKTNYSLQELETNLGVCLASLPRLDNDIELNFPEVNQQFINANKTESVITKSFAKDLPAVDVEKADINLLKNDTEVELDTNHASSPQGKPDMDKECSRLSKYRKLKRNINDDNDMSQAKAQATRVDSVIIKNPDNTRILEDNADIFRSGDYSQKYSQEFAINLATQSKNSQVLNESEEKLTKPSHEENAENDFPASCIMQAKTYSDNTDIVSEDLSTPYRDVSNRHLNNTVLDMPMNLSPQAKSYSTHGGEDFKSNKGNGKTKRNDGLVNTVMTNDSQNTRIEISNEKLKKTIEGGYGDVQVYEPFVDSIRVNSPRSYVGDKSRTENDTVVKSDSETETLAKVEHSACNLHAVAETQLLPALEDESASYLRSDMALPKTEGCPESVPKLDTTVSTNTDEQTVSCLGSSAPVLPKAEVDSGLNPETLNLSQSGEQTSFDPNLLVLSKEEECTASLNSSTIVLSKSKDLPCDLNSVEKCCNEKNMIFQNPQNTETICSTPIDTTEISQSSVDPTETDIRKCQVHAGNKSTISKLFDDKKIIQDSLEDTPMDAPNNDKSTSHNTETLHENTEQFPQSDKIEKTCMKEEDNSSFSSKFERNTNKSCIPHRKRSTEYVSNSSLKTHSKKHKIKLHNKNKTLLGKSTNEPQITPEVTKNYISCSREESNTSMIASQDINLTNVSLRREISMASEFSLHLSDGNQDISDILENNTTVPDKSSTDTVLNVDKMTLDNTNVDFTLYSPSPSYKELACETSEEGSSVEKVHQNDFLADGHFNEKETPCVTNVNMHKNNSNNDSKEIIYSPKHINENYQRTDHLHFEGMSRSNNDSACCTVNDDQNDSTEEIINVFVKPPYMKKELFSSRFQNLLTYNEGMSGPTNMNECNNIFLFETSQQDNIPDGRIKIQNYNSLNWKTVDSEQNENDRRKQCLLTEIDQQTCDITVTNESKSLSEENKHLTNLTSNVSDDCNESNLFDSLKEIPLHKEDKIEDYEQPENYIKEPIKNDVVENREKISKNEDISNEVNGAGGIDEELNSEVFVDLVKNEGDIILLDDQNENIFQGDDDDCRSTSNLQDDLNNKRNPHRLRDKPRLFLKRSLSDSALHVYNDEADETSDKKCFLLPNKRKKNYISNNLEESRLLNIIQNSRRNSISTICNENNISFCILIDDNCILAEESYEQEDVNYGQTESSCLNDVQQEKCLEIPENIVIEAGNEIECVESKAWVENVDYEEIIETEDIAENIVIGEPTTPKDTDSSDYESDDGDMGILTSAAIDHTNKVKHIYGDNLCTNDAQLVDALYRTPQMDVNKRLMDKESQIHEKTKYYDSDSLEMLLAEPIDNTYKCSPRESTSDYMTKNVSCRTGSSFLDTDSNVIEEENSESREKLSFSNINEKNIKTSQSSELSLVNVFSYERQEDGSYTSSSPEVSSTTSEEKNPSLLMKFSNYKGSKISEVNSLTPVHNRKENSCKFTETEYLNPNYANTSQRPLITKAAQKYIPPLKETIPDLKVKLTLPQQCLLKLKENKASKEEPKLETRNKSCNNNNINLRKVIPKKVKPKFEDVLKNIDEVQFRKHRDRNKKPRKMVPKVVIKKTGNGSHYASTPAKTSFNPDLTGRKWQPWVFIEKNIFVDKMALRNKTKAVFSHRKKTYVLNENFCKYKSISSAKFIITQPTLNEFSTGNLKYTIKLKHSY